VDTVPICDKPGTTALRPSRLFLPNPSKRLNWASAGISVQQVVASASFSHLDPRKDPFDGADALQAKGDNFLLTLESTPECILLGNREFNESTSENRRCCR
jgi:hypothetical protein